jgi:hypothetical protein
VNINEYITVNQKRILVNVSGQTIFSVEQITDIIHQYDGYTEEENINKLLIK